MSSSTYECPHCKNRIPVPYHPPCPVCGFVIDHLVDPAKMNSFQQQKWNEHNDLIMGRSIQLYDGKEYNASFDYAGAGSIEQIVMFAISYGDRSVTPVLGGRHPNEVIVAYFPEIMGSGISRYSRLTVPASGVCIMSPGSPRWGHPFPTMENWVRKNFRGVKTFCVLCSEPTDFGQPLCPKCYAANPDWRKLI